MNPAFGAVRNLAVKAVGAVHRFNRDRMHAAKIQNPYLDGPARPLSTELTFKLPIVRGNIPPALDGCYSRIGPNPLVKVNPANHHWVVGDGMLHGVRLKNGAALWYRNRWLRSTAVSEALMERPKPGPRRYSDNVNTNVVKHAGQTWALVEAGAWPVRVDSHLETVAHDPFGGSLKGSFAAHPHLDNKSGALHAICYDAQEANIIRHVVVGADGKVQREEPISVRHGPSIHDCMITENFVIILDLPVTLAMSKFLKGYTFPYAWNPSHKARVGILGKNSPGNGVIWCEVDPCYVFHIANAFESAEGVVTMDLVASPKMFDQNQLGPSIDHSVFERWIVDLEIRRVSREVLDNTKQEFPRIDDRYTGMKNRWVWMVQMLPTGTGDFCPGNKIIRHDLKYGRQAFHDFGEGKLASEFAFVPRSEDAPEGDGWLMGYVVDSAAKTSELVIIDTNNFEGDPVACVLIPHAIPLGFHGNWLPAD